MSVSFGTRTKPEHIKYPIRRCISSFLPADFDFDGAIRWAEEHCYSPATLFASSPYEVTVNAGYDTPFVDSVKRIQSLCASLGTGPNYDVRVRLTSGLNRNADWHTDTRHRGPLNEDDRRIRNIIIFLEKTPFEATQFVDVDWDDKSDVNGKYYRCPRSLPRGSAVYFSGIALHRAPPIGVISPFGDTEHEETRKFMEQIRRVSVSAQFHIPLSVTRDAEEAILESMFGKNVFDPEEFKLPISIQDQAAYFDKQADLVAYRSSVEQPTRRVRQ
jgi:hypothetical protein